MNHPARGAQQPLIELMSHPRSCIMGLEGIGMNKLTRITLDPQVMGGKPCIRGMRVTVGTVVGLLASGHSMKDVLDAYPYLEEDDLLEALAYASWRAEEVEIPLAEHE